MSARPKAWVCGGQLAGITGSNAADDIHVCPVSAVCRQAKVSESGRSLVQRSPTEYGVTDCDQAPSTRKALAP